MSSSTSSSSPAREHGAARFFASLVVCVLLVEVAFGWLLPRNPGRHEVDRRVARIAKETRASRNVLLSDSVSYGVLDGIELPDDVLDLSTNQAISVAGNAFLVERLFERLDALAISPPVDTVLYVVGPTGLEVALDSKRFNEPYFTSVFTRAAEIAAVDERLDRPDLVRAMRVARTRARFEFPSYARRGVLIEPLTNALRGLKRGLYGAAAMPTTPTARARELIEERSQRAVFEPSSVTRAFLPVLAAECERRGVRLVLAPPPVAPTLLAAWKRTGMWDGYVGFLADVARPHALVRVAPSCPVAFDTDAAFYDGVHLEQAAKSTWGEALAALLATDLDAAAFGAVEAP